MASISSAFDQYSPILYRILYPFGYHRGYRCHMRLLGPIGVRLRPDSNRYYCSVYHYIPDPFFHIVDIGNLCPLGVSANTAILDPPGKTLTSDEVFESLHPLLANNGWREIFDNMTIIQSYDLEIHELAKEYAHLSCRFRYTRNPPSNVQELVAAFDHVEQNFNDQSSTLINFGYLLAHTFSSIRAKLKHTQREVAKMQEQAKTSKNRSNDQMDIIQDRFLRYSEIMKCSLDQISIEARGLMKLIEQGLGDISTVQQELNQTWEQVEKDRESLRPW